MRRNDSLTMSTGKIEETSPESVSTDFVLTPTSTVSEGSDQNPQSSKPTKCGALLGLGLENISFSDPWNSVRKPSKDATMRPEVEPFKPIAGAMTFLNADSTPDNSPELNQTAPAHGYTDILPIGSGTRNSPSVSFVALTEGPNFTTEGDINFNGSHFVEFSGIPVHWTLNGHLNKALVDCGIAANLTSTAPAYGPAGTFILYAWFDDLRAAMDARDAFCVVLTTASIKFIDQHQYFGVDNTHPRARRLSTYDGQVEFFARFIGQPDIHTIFQRVREFALGYGEIRTISQMNKSADGMAFFRVEYFAMSSADSVAPEGDVSDTFDLGNNLIIQAREYLPEGYQRYCHPAATTAQRGAGASLGLIPAMAQLSIAGQRDTLPESGSIQESATRRTAWSGDHFVDPRAVTVNGVAVMDTLHDRDPRERPYLPSELFDFWPDTKHIPALHDRRRNDTANQPQTVDIRKIEAGIDVRTTIMLRNIPNRVNAAELKDLLDITSKGHYDFTYLRVDFSNCCNVGYAFINFVRPEFIVHFVKKRIGRPWGVCNSEKIAEVSYATIQGQDCLIAKFRNSSVMQEYTGFRPKVYYHVDSTDMPEDKSPGDEAPFPEPDNLSKLQRSLDNAQTNGLYPPRAGQQNREERRHRSQYDRGTPRAMYEESHFNRQDQKSRQHMNEPRLVRVVTWVDPRDQDADYDQAYRGGNRGYREDFRGNRRGDYRSDFPGDRRDNYSGDRRDSYPGDRRDNYPGDQHNGYRGDYRGDQRVGGYRGDQRDNFTPRRGNNYGPRGNSNYSGRRDYTPRDNTVFRSCKSRPPRSQPYYDDEY
ncbi:hypothetical protein MBLNU459_g5280t1 [Dothideomycetes sp. NU459]